VDCGGSGVSCLLCHFLPLPLLPSLPFIHLSLSAGRTRTDADILHSNFGKPGTPYDFAATDIGRLKAKAAELEEAQKGMKKKINPKVINMLDRYVTSCVAYSDVLLFLTKILVWRKKKLR
jgi:hypothetical protein